MGNGTDILLSDLYKSLPLGELLMIPCYGQIGKEADIPKSDQFLNPCLLEG